MGNIKWIFYCGLLLLAISFNGKYTCFRCREKEKNIVQDIGQKNETDFCDLFQNACIYERNEHHVHFIMIVIYCNLQL